MTDNEIIKALERTASWVCDECKFHGEMCDGDKCEKVIAENALDLINRQKDEIESLKQIVEQQDKEILTLQKRIINWRADIDYRPEDIKSEAIKEFVERLKDELRLDDDCGYHCYDCCYECKDYVPVVDNLVKEMTEVSE